MRRLSDQSEPSCSAYVRLSLGAGTDYAHNRTEQDAGRRPLPDTIRRGAVSGRPGIWSSGPAGPPPDVTVRCAGRRGPERGGQHGAELRQLSNTHTDSSEVRNMDRDTAAADTGKGWSAVPAHPRTGVGSDTGNRVGQTGGGDKHTSRTEDRGRRLMKRTRRQTAVSVRGSTVSRQKCPANQEKMGSWGLGHVRLHHHHCYPARSARRISPPPRAGDFLYRDVTWAAKIPLLYRNTWKDRSD